MTKLDNFLKFLVKNFVTKVDKIFVTFWAILKTSVATFWASLGKIWSPFLLLVNLEGSTPYLFYVPSAPTHICAKKINNTGHC